MNTDHSLTITIDPKYGADHTLTCNAAPGAACITWCTEQCEGPSEEHEMHEVTTVPCMLIEWWNWDTTSSIEGYTGLRTELVSGPIVATSWGEDGIEWHYPEPSVSGSGS